MIAVPSAALTGLGKRDATSTLSAGVAMPTHGRTFISLHRWRFDRAQVQRCQCLLLYPFRLLNRGRHNIS